MTLLLPKKYTAIARILIEPPAGNDPRSSTAVSPIYLESLHSYELFASSDSLFLQAVQKFGLRQGSEPIDTLKKSALKTEMPRNMKILEVQATLADPKTAHALALYIAEETVKLNRAVSREADQELIGEAEKQSAQVRTRLQSVEQTWARSLGEVSVEQLKAELTADEELRATLQRELAESEVMADRDRVDGYRKQLDSLRANIASKRKLLADRSGRGRDHLRACGRADSHGIGRDPPAGRPFVARLSRRAAADHRSGHRAGAAFISEFTPQRADRPVRGRYVVSALSGARGELYRAE